MTTAVNVRVTYQRFFKNFLPSLIFAFVIGLLQGSYLAESVMLLMISTPLIILGIVVSGIFIYLVPVSANAYSDIDSMYRFSLLFVLLGVLGLSYLGGDGYSTISQAAIVTGFNLFDFGALTLSIVTIRKLQLGASFFIGSGRSLVYLCFAIGLFAGYTAMPLFEIMGSSDGYLLVSGIALALLVITVLMPLHKFDVDTASAQNTSVAAKMRPESFNLLQAEAGAGTQGDDGSAPVYTPWKRICKEVAANYQLSPREVEVFLLVAKGRNAEHIQEKLIISPHTAKTHIANIYHKLEVHSQQELLDLIESFKNE
jgi:DNA-binding CsgD family transcriptional regulator